MKFKDKKVIVTGAGRSIGKTIALDLAREGADIVISYRSNEPGAAATVEEIKRLGRQACCIHADFSNNKEVDAFAHQAIDFLGHVDCLVNNAGMLFRDKFLEITPENLSTVYQVNTIAPFYLMQMVAKDMIAKKVKGSIVNISSIAGTFTFTQGLGYASSKAAMNKMTQNAALELAPHQIRVNVVAPGVIEAGMNETTATTNPELWAKYCQGIPLNRPGTPKDISQATCFLLSDDANWMTGKIIEVDGGHVL